mmetsp:Transcript_53569/g.120799  ORF Transcript_53569/g.120799 Transcript_53569/m.120799 type:complete len:84 (-) Transcript_53569:166-417(-)
MPQEARFRLVPSGALPDPQSQGAKLGQESGFSRVLPPKEPATDPKAGPWIHPQNAIMTEVKIEGAVFTVPMHHGTLFVVGGDN